MKPIPSLFKHSHYIILIGIIILATTFRLIGTNWDSGAHLHPDERFLTMVATGISWPKTIQEYFDTQHSPLNPHNEGFSFYVYGTYPVHLTKLVSEFFHRDTYDLLPIVGRYASTLADIVTVILVYLIAAYLAKSPVAGLFAALCYASAALPIQVSHFFTVDPYATLFATLTVYRVSQGKFGWITGVTMALAIGAKISTIFILPIVGVAFLIHLPTHKNTTPHYRVWLHILGIGIITSISCLITLRGVYPYLFDGWMLNENVLNNWRQLSSFDGPTTSFPPGLQWIGVSQYQTIIDMVMWGLGFPLGILAICSIGYYCFVSLKNKHLRPIFIVVLWILIVWIYQSLQFAKPMRYLLPIYPAICALCGMFLHTIFLRLSHTIHRRYFVTLSFCLLLLWPLSFVSIYTRQHTRVEASQWIYTHIPENSTIAWEHWDDPLPFSIPGYTPNAYTQIQLPSFDPDDGQKLKKIQEVLVASDYIILSSNRAYGALNRAKLRFPLMTTFYTKLFSGSLGFTLQAQFVSRPTLPLPIPAQCLHMPGFYYGYASQPIEQCLGYGIQFVDDYADETFTVYDHPKVLIFKNDKHLSSEQIAHYLYE